MFGCFNQLLFVLPIWSTSRLIGASLESLRPGDVVELDRGNIFDFLCAESTGFECYLPERQRVVKIYPDGRRQIIITNNVVKCRNITTNATFIVRWGKNSSFEVLAGTPIYKYDKTWVLDECGIVCVQVNEISEINSMGDLTSLGKIGITIFSKCTGRRCGGAQVSSEEVNSTPVEFPDKIQVHRQDHPEEKRNFKLPLHCQFDTPRLDFIGVAILKLVKYEKPLRLKVMGPKNKDSHEDFQ